MTFHDRRSSDALIAEIIERARTALSSPDGICREESVNHARAAVDRVRTQRRRR